VCTRGSLHPAGPRHANHSRPGWGGRHSIKPDTCRWVQSSCNKHCCHRQQAVSHRHYPAPFRSCHCSPHLAGQPQPLVVGCLVGREIQPQSLSSGP
jgi:hypothetical protein